MKSNSWLMSYVIEGLLGFILFKCSSYILHTPERDTQSAHAAPRHQEEERRRLLATHLPCIR